MKKFIVFMLILMFSLPCFGDCMVSLTNKQFNNLMLIHRECEKQYPEFGGFNGNQGEMNAIGVSEDSGIQLFINSIDIDAVKENDPTKKEMRSLRRKFKDMGLNNRDLEIMGLTNDIPDGQ